MSFDGWKEQTLDAVLEFSNGKKRPKNDGSIPVYGGNGVMDYCSQSNAEGENIIIGRVGAYCGNVYYENQPCWISDNAILARPKDNNVGKFLYYKLINLNLSSMRIGSSQPLLTQSILKEIVTQIPNKSTQQKIASILSALDDKIELNNRMNKVLEQMAQVIFKQWFVDFEFPNENGEPYKSSGGEMEWCEELGKEIPRGWRVGTVSNLGTVVGGGTPSSSKEEFYADLGIPWITPKDLSMNKNKFIYRGSRDITEAGLKNSAAKLMPEGTVLFTSRAPIGYIAIAGNSVTTNQGFKSIIPDDEVGTEFVYCFLKENLSAIENMATGSTFKEVSGNVLKNIPALLPEPNLIKQFSEIVKIHNDKIKNNEKQIDYLSSLRDILLPKLMSGEIDVSEIEL
ncbi:restriction endonuclease subunit S [Brevibacillus composti]|uniref:Restriction endonuclease subunit S n=1 Tax=Brevibacillus composti TaxID=2796470 RepID=A0A7T5ELS2_9BACL|nr:restriction endonuclease subunit S [Brevibacillus composti]QQE74980.1 restriction endonuclease subunit S [Brevibacillus composti]QUO42065.1 restriction endonuclease subunit S [Brevibacillus composti]